MKFHLSLLLVLVIYMAGYSQQIKNIEDNGVNVQNSSQGTGYFQWINLRLAGNTLSAQNTNGGITLSPNGTGNVSIGSGQLLIPNGTSSSPGISFSGNSDRGMFSGSGFLGFSFGGTEIFRASSTKGLQMVIGGFYTGGGIRVFTTGGVPDSGFEPPTTSVAAATDDKVFIFDTSDSDNPKQVSAQSIADLAGPGIANLEDSGTDVQNSTSGTGSFKWDNLSFDGNTISSTDTDGNVTIDPNGVGDIRLNPTGNNKDVLIGENPPGAFGNDGGLGVDGIIKLRDNYPVHWGSTGSPEIIAHSTQKWMSLSANYNQNALVISDTDSDVKIASGMALNWATVDPVAYNSLVDVGLKRNTAGVLEVTNGSTGSGALQVGNLNTNGNTLSSTNTNGNIILDPNGTGQVDFSSSQLANVVDPTNPQDAATKAYVDANSGASNIVNNGSGASVGNLLMDGNTISSLNTNGVIVLSPNGSGPIELQSGTVRVGSSSLQGNRTIKSFSSDPNSDLNLEAKGTGAVKIQGNYQLQANDGSVGSPSISFMNDSNSGFYNLGADEFAATVGGSQVMKFQSGTITSTGVLIPGGTQSLGLSALAWSNVYTEDLTMGDNSSTATNHTISANGSSPNIDLTFSPKGTGTIKTPVGYETNIAGDQDLINKKYFVDNTAALLTNVSDPVNPQDVATKAYVDANSGASFPLLAPNGSITAPSYSFNGDTDTGIHYSNGNIEFGVGGAYKMAVGPAGLFMTGGSEIYSTFGSAGTPAITFNGDSNLGVYRVSEDQLGLSAGGSNVLTVGNTVGTTITNNTDPDTNLINATEGSLAWDSTDDEFRVYNGTSWASLDNSPNNIVDNGTGVLVGNLLMDTNTLSSTNTDGNIIFDPNGTGLVDFSSSQLTNVADPVNLQDAATKAYVDATVGGSTGNLDLSGNTISSTNQDGDIIISPNGSGNVGIGTESPKTALDVRGDLIIDGTNIYTGPENQEYNRFLSLLNSPDLKTASRLKVGGLLISSLYNYADPAQNDLIVRGNVGIGTPVPSAKLDVNGRIRATQDFPSINTTEEIASFNRTTSGLANDNIGGYVSIGVEDDGGINREIRLQNILQDATTSSPNAMFRVSARDAGVERNILDISNNSDLIAIGPGVAYNAAFNSVLIGGSAVGTGNHIVALGHGANIGNYTYSIGIGSSADVNGHDAIAIGSDSEAWGRAVSVGRFATASSTGSQAYGMYSTSTAPGAILMGYHTSTQTNSLANSFELAWDGNTAFKVGETYGTGITAKADPDTELIDAVNGAIAYDSTDHEFRAMVNGSWETLGGSPNAIENFGTGADAIAIGNSSMATQSGSLAFGNGTMAEASDAIAMGTGAGVTSGLKNSGSVSIGANTNSWNNTSDIGQRSVAVGHSSYSSGEFSVAIGRIAAATESNATAVGADANATGPSSLALGKLSLASAISSIAIGNGAKSSNTNNISIGDDAGDAAGTIWNGAVSIGDQANSGTTDIGQHGVAIGSSAESRNTHSIAIGRGMKASADYSILMGGDNVTGNTENTTPNSFMLSFNGDSPFKVGSTYGTGITTDGNPDLNLVDAVNGVIAYDTTDHEFRAMVNGSWEKLGSNPNAIENLATGTNAISLGLNSAAEALDVIAIGTNAGTTSGATIGTGSVSIGAGVNANTGNIGQNSVAIGYGAESRGTGGVAIGDVAVSTGTPAIAIGDGAQALSGNSISIGSSSVADAVNAIAIGNSADANAFGDDAIAIGMNAQSNESQAIAIGFETIASSTSAMAIGDGAEANASHTIAIGTDAGDNTTGTDGINSVSIGSQANSVNTQAIGEGSIAIGYAAQTPGLGSIAIGNAADTDAAASKAISIGDNANAWNTGGIAIGSETRASAQGAIIMGYHTGIQQNSLANSFELAWDGSTAFKVGSTYGTGITTDGNPDLNLVDAVNGVIAYDTTDHEFRAKVNGSWETLGGGIANLEDNGTNIQNTTAATGYFQWDDIRIDQNNIDLGINGVTTGSSRNIIAKGVGSDIDLNSYSQGNGRINLYSDNGVAVRGAVGGVSRLDFALSGSFKTELMFNNTTSDFTINNTNGGGDIVLTPGTGGTVRVASGYEANISADVDLINKKYFDDNTASLLTNVSDPINPQDVATKAYVDANTSGHTVAVNRHLISDGSGGFWDSEMVHIPGGSMRMGVSSSSTGTSRSILAEGTASNIDIVMRSKGTFGVQLESVNTGLTNTLHNTLTLNHSTTGTPAAGFGSSLRFRLDGLDIGYLDYVLTDATASDEDTEFRFRGIKGGSAATFLDVSEDGINFTNGTVILPAGPATAVTGALRYNNGGSQTLEVYDSGWKSIAASPWTSNASDINFTGGNVAIGTASIPTGYKLAVDGKIITEEVLVELSGSWPDYVFESGYDLTSLEALEAYIKANKHLPEIPTAREIEENGVELGNMNLLLLKKIEELTLYTLEQEKRIKELEKKNKKLSESPDDYSQQLLALLARIEKLENK